MHDDTIGRNADKIWKKVTTATLWTNEIASSEASHEWRAAIGPMTFGKDEQDGIVFSLEYIWPFGAQTRNLVSRPKILQNIPNYAMRSQKPIATTESETSSLCIKGIESGNGPWEWDYVFVDVGEWEREWTVSVSACGFQREGVRIKFLYKC